MSLKKINNKLKILVIIIGLLIPLVIFLNRFLIPDSSFDSVNYHVFSGQRSLDFWKFNDLEFYPAGLHSFPYFFDMFGGVVRSFFGYRLGSGTSLIFLYGVIYLIYKLISLIGKKHLITLDWLSIFLFVNIFISFEKYFQIATYFVDIISEFFVLLSLYFAFKYFNNLNKNWLWWSCIVMGIAVMGKLTNLIFAIPLVVIFVFFLWKENISTMNQKILILIKVSILLILPILIQSIPNIINTGNPIFPFYNAIFKSKYSEAVSFQNMSFGPITLKEKILWPIITLYEPVRLGEAHDLFNDFKLNIYFIFGILSLVGFYFIDSKKKKLFGLLNIYFITTFIFWNFTFGYLRYGLFLETLGGLLLFIWWQMLRTEKFKWKTFGLFFIILFSILLVWRDKMAINFAMAYDLSWRRGYIYNTDYINERNNFYKNNIWVDDEGYDPELYLNCSIPNLTFYTLSNFNELPVVNIDRRSNLVTTRNINYKNEVANRIKKHIGKTEKIKFVTMAANGGLNNQYVNCKDNLISLNYKIEKEVFVDNFLGFKNQTFVVMFGRLDL